MTSSKAMLTMTGIDLPGRFPWLPNQFVKSKEFIRDDNGFICAVKFETTQGTFQVAPNTSMVFPIRDDGSLRDWRTADHPPHLHEMAIGDILAAPGSVDPEDHLIITKMSRRQGPDTGYVILYTYRAMAMSTVRWLCHRSVPFEYGLVIEDVPESRVGSPVRGPYRDTETGAIYYFKIHPTGKGRWPADIPVFQYQESGEHTSRPPAVVDVKQNLWWRIEYTGASRTDRHPNDPVIVSAKRHASYRRRNG